jgi:hypothetical protein
MGEGYILSGKGPQAPKKYGTSPTQPRSRVQVRLGQYMRHAWKVATFAISGAAAPLP